MSLASPQDFHKAKGLIMRHLAERGPTRRQEFSRFKMWGVGAAALDLAIISLKADGIIESLYTFPRTGHGSRPTYYALTSALDAGQKIPDNTVREKEAIAEILREDRATPVRF